MDGPQHRRFVLLGLALLAGSLLLAGRQWFFKPTEQAIVTPAATVAVRGVETQADEVEPTAVDEAPSGSAAPSASVATTGSFRGRIIDAATRQPVKQFEVQLTRIQRNEGTSAQEAPLTQTFQTQSGRFAWKDLAAASWRATVSAPGYQQFDLGELRIVAGKTSREAIIPLLHGYVVRGRVSERSTGAGIGGASITFRETSLWRGDPTARSHTTSRDDGSFVLDGVAGGDITLIVHAIGHGSRELEIEVDDKIQPVEIALSTGGTLAGMVTTVTGAPVKGQIILFGPEMNFVNETNDAGQFSFQNLRAGRYGLAASGAGGSSRQEMLLGEDERKEGIILTFAPGRSVRGIVRGLRPEQFQRAVLNLRSSNQAYFQAKPDERGSYAFNGVPAGKAFISVSAETRQVFKTVDVPADQDVVALDIFFPSGVRLSGTVTQDGKPAAQKMVWISPVGAAVRVSYHATTTEEGRYEVEDVVPGEYSVRAGENIYRKISIAADTVLNIDIPSEQLSGGVTEDDGAVPVVGADVYVRGVETATAHMHAYKTTDNFGEFSITGIEPGDIVLIVHKAGYEIYSEKIVWSAPITRKKIMLRKVTGPEVRAQVAAGKEQVRGFMIYENIPGSEYGIDLWIPLDREGLGYMPSALVGHTFQIYTRDKPIVIEEWGGQALELKL